MTQVRYRHYCVCLFVPNMLLLFAALLLLCSIADHAPVIRMQASALPTVFIDGEAGTTGLQVHDRLAGRTDLRLVSLPEAQRKVCSLFTAPREACRNNAGRFHLPFLQDPAARKEMLNTSSAVILCLPVSTPPSHPFRPLSMRGALPLLPQDDAAVEAVGMLEPGSSTVVIDASTAFRTAPGWVYGFPELCPGHAAQIAASKRIANPGCYPTGFIALTRPLVDAGLLPPTTPLVCHAVSGYSGGGKPLMKIFEQGPHEPWGAYGFNLAHKHLPEMAFWAHLARAPIFCPSVGDFAQGMVVSVPLHLDLLPPAATPAALQAALAAHYAGSEFVSVRPLNDSSSLERGSFLRPDALNGTNRLELFVWGNEKTKTAWLCARLDNLGKGKRLVVLWGFCVLERLTVNSPGRSIRRRGAEPQPRARPSVVALPRHNLSTIYL